jgi:hypothetical protein
MLLFQTVIGDESTPLQVGQFRTNSRRINSKAGEPANVSRARYYYKNARDVIQTLCV